MQGCSWVWVTCEIEPIHMFHSFLFFCINWIGLELTRPNLSWFGLGNIFYFFGPVAPQMLTKQVTFLHLYFLIILIKCVPVTTSALQIALTHTLFSRVLASDSCLQETPTHCGCLPDTIVPSVGPTSSVSLSHQCRNNKPGTEEPQCREINIGCCNCVNKDTT